MEDVPSYAPLPSGLYPCAACQDVIGVYEPAVLVLRGGGTVESSPLALGDPGSLVAIYHRYCGTARAAAAPE